VVRVGRYFTWLPYHDSEKAFLSVVFGSPISVRQEEEPSQEYIDQLFDQYITQVKAIFEEYKGKFGSVSPHTKAMRHGDRGLTVTCSTMFAFFLLSSYPANETLAFKEAREPKGAASPNSGKKVQ
jgi:hypothetical protein